MLKVSEDEEYVVLDVRAKTDLDGVQKKNREGVAQWSVECLWRPLDGSKAEVVNITMDSKLMPEFTPMGHAAAGVFADAWGTGGSHGKYYTCTELVELEG